MHSLKYKYWLGGGGPKEKVKPLSIFGYSAILQIFAFARRLENNGYGVVANTIPVKSSANFERDGVFELRRLHMCD